MKTHEKTKNTAYLRGFAVVFAFLIVLAGCTGPDNPFSSEGTEQGISIDDLNIDVKYAESYDETSITFSRYWPEGITVSLGKLKSTEDGEILVDYDRYHKTIGFDKQGYMISVIEYLEGDEGMNMPESIYQKYKSTMPSENVNYDPIVKEVMRDGIIKLYSKSGKLISEEFYDPELYRVDIADLDSTLIWSDYQNTEKSIRNNLNLLDNRGIDYDVEQGVYAKYVEESKNEGLLFEYIDDLRTGLNVSTSVYNRDGHISSILLNNYSFISKIPTLQSQTRFRYGNVNGEWQIAYRTLTTRNNIKVIRK